MKRKATPRSRSGCATCKFRHQKCDETKPACKKCILFGAVCDFLDPSSPAILPRKSKKVPGEVVFAIGNKNNNVTQRALILEPKSSLPTNQNVEVLAHLDYFRNVCMRSFDGYIDSKTWNSLVIQVADAEPAILGGVLALSTIHRLKSCPPNNDTFRQSLQPLAHYQGAIRLLNKRLSNPTGSPEMALIASILFCMYEKLNANHESSMNHLIGGLGIIKDIIAKSPELLHTPGLFRDLSLSFSRLDIGASEIYPDYLAEALRPPVLPEKFFNSNEACDVLCDITARTHRLSKLHRGCECSVPYTKLHVSVIGQLRALTELLNQWHIQFLTFLAKRAQEQKPSISTQIANNMVLLRYFVALITITRLEGIDEMAYDRCEMGFREILRISGETLALYSADGAGESFTPRSQVDVGIGPRLYLTAKKCRNLDIRIRAMEMLWRSEPEGSFVAKPMAAAGWWIAKQEHGRDVGGPEKSVSKERRFVHAGMDFDYAKRVVMMKGTRISAEGEETHVWGKMRWTDGNRLDSIVEEEASEEELGDVHFWEFIT